MFFNLEFSIEIKGFSQFILNFKNYVIIAISEVGL